MPDYNHSFSCVCGFCSGVSVSGGGGQRGYLNLSNSLASISTPKVSPTPQTDEAQTYKTNCWWCGVDVCYHTNGYGDSILFDSLGSPWEVHPCWEEHREKHKNVEIFDLKVEQFNCLVLSGAIRRLQAEGDIPTENNVAIEMGISVEDLQRCYKSLYVIISRAYGRIVLAKGF